MLTLVEVRSSQGSLLSLPLEDVSDGLILQDVEGLDPVKATIVSSSFAGMDGSQYQSSRREDRNLILKLDLEPDYITSSVRDLRKRLYKYFMPKSYVSLRFYDSDGLTVDISGRVESFESPLFTNEPEVSISILCFDPDFIDLTPVELNGMTTSGTTETLITYDGSVETGILFTLNLDRNLTEFTFYHRPPDGTLRSMEFAASLVAGDVLKISTVAGNKGANLNRSNSDSSILYGISPQSNWIELMQGDNYIRVYAEGIPIPYNITYTNRYGGL